MSSVDLQSVIALAPADVYAALCDVERRPELDPATVEVEPFAGEVVEGSTFSGKGTLTGDESEFEGAVTALEKDRLVGLGFAFRNGARLHERWRLSPTPSGTLINYHADLRLPGGPLGWLMDRLLAGAGFRKQREAMLAYMKARLEGRVNQ